MPAEKKLKAGPRLVFFSGGSALRDFSAVLAASGSNSGHVITTFDSGGSAGVLRQYFNIPAVGDLRARLAALAPLESPEQRQAVALWEKRFSLDASAAALADELKKLAQGRSPALSGLEPALRRALPNLLAEFYAHMPSGFDLRGACLGNLALAGSCFSGNSLPEAVNLCADLLACRGRVAPVSEDAVQLAVRLASGRVLLGQHRFSSKFFSQENSRLFVENGPIEELWLNRGLDQVLPASACLSPAAAKLIGEAGLICYPPGSFYSSLLANLLPQGAGRAVAANPCPKVFIPNPGVDPELLGLSLRQQVERLLAALRADAPLAGTADLLNYVLLDSRQGMYPGGSCRDWLAGQGITLCDLPLVDSAFAEETAQPGAKACSGAVRRRPWLHIEPNFVHTQLLRLVAEHKKLMKSGQ